ncbi:MAG: UPF0149 family protein [Granulosicoccaceae bacterium]
MSSRYENISTGLLNLAVTISAAESHGILVGLLCTMPSGVAKKHWFTELLDIAGASPESVAGNARELKELDDWFSESVQFMNDPELSFQLFLPADSVSFMERQNALADFCAGYNYGFGIGMAGKRNQKLPEDTREFLQDIQAIEGADPAKGDQADENAFVEISEYVRMGVLLVHEEHQPVARSINASPTANKVH